MQEYISARQWWRDKLSAYARLRFRLKTSKPYRIIKALATGKA